VAWASLHKFRNAPIEDGPMFSRNAAQIVQRSQRRTTNRMTCGFERNFTDTKLAKIGQNTLPLASPTPRNFAVVAKLFRKPSTGPVSFPSTPPNSKLRISVIFGISFSNPLSIASVPLTMIFPTKPLKMELMLLQWTASLISKCSLWALMMVLSSSS
jgi:hypothetical protein